MSIALLRSPAGAAALSAARALVASGTAALPALERLRGEYGAELAAAAWTQELLRERGAAKFGPDAASMLFTPAGLEQSTRAPVAAHRAARLAGRQSAVDLGCGIGGDLRALAAVVPRVVGVELDPQTALCAAHNAPAADVVCADARTHDLSGYDVVFADPARRGARGRVFRVADYTPPWDWLRTVLVSRDAVAKLAPGIPHDLVPDGVEAEWVSFEGEVKEAVLWSGSLATPGIGRRATVLRAAAGRGAPPSVHTLTGTGAAADVGPLGRWLHEPDGAVIRAGLVAELTELVDGRLLDPTIAYVTTDSDAVSPYSRRLAVLEALPFSLKRLREVLRARGVGRLDVKKRGTAVDPEQLRRDLRLRGSEHAVVVLTRIAGEHWAVICAP